jgi:hypothetical protein
MFPCLVVMQGSKPPLVFRYSVRAVFDKMACYHDLSEQGHQENMILLDQHIHLRVTNGYPVLILAE